MRRSWWRKPRREDYATQQEWADAMLTPTPMPLVVTMAVFALFWLGVAWASPRAQVPDPFAGQNEPPPAAFIPPALPTQQPTTVAEKQAYIDTCVQMGGLPVVLAGPNGLSQGIGCAEPVGR